MPINLRSQKTNYLYLVLVLLFSVSGFFRLYALNQRSMGADTMEFYKIVQAGISPQELIQNSQQYVPTLAPFWFAAHNAFIQLLHLNVTFGSVRLLDALTGLITVWAFYCLGCHLVNRFTGLLAAIFTGFHPVLIQMSRESYFYSAILLGAVLIIWGFLTLLDAINEKHPPGIPFYLCTFSGYFIITYTHSSPWAFAAITGFFMYYVLLRATIKKIIIWHPVYILTGGFLLLILPLLFSEWGVKIALSQFIGGESKHWAQIFGEQDRIADIPRYAAALRSFLFGKSWLGSVLNLLILISIPAWLVRTWKHEQKTRVISIMGFLLICIQLLIHAQSVHGVKSAHLTPLIPFAVIAMCAGFNELTRWSQRVLKRSAYPSETAKVICCVLIILVFALPATWSMHVESNSPWQTVARWADANLPSGTTILCDRWYTPWNELHINSSSNVFYTFTVPNEPTDQYINNNWRKTAIDFINANPFCAYLDRRQYWSTLGPWKEPQSYFAHSKIFRDEANLKLINVGLAYRDPFDLAATTNMELRLFYNTEADVLDRCKDEGKRAVVGFGDGWNYLKPWNPPANWPQQLTQLLWIQAGAYQTQNNKTYASLNELNNIPQQTLTGFLNQGRWAEYRTPSTKAILRVFNLTNQPQQANLLITGISLSGSVEATIADKHLVFPQALLTTKLESLTLKPGEQQLSFTVPPNQLLLILNASIQTP